ncbi:hypothetical protein WJ438_21210 [Streptomyces sp. GD-15H]|uniref:hypothetical protein n=1 Tax=Streptomyces sp. GD-15H TaxID=3129112 RepID=UPI0032471729
MRTADPQLGMVGSRRLSDLERCASRDEARRTRRFLADAKPHGHKYASGAVLAVVARQQEGQVTVFPSHVDDLQELAPDTITVEKV